MWPLANTFRERTPSSTKIMMNNWTVVRKGKVRPPRGAPGAGGAGQVGLPRVAACRAGPVQEGGDRGGEGGGRPRWGCGGASSGRWSPLCDSSTCGTQGASFAQPAKSQHRGHHAGTISTQYGLQLATGFALFTSARTVFFHILYLEGL